MRAKEKSLSRKISNCAANVAICLLLIQPITVRATLVERDLVPGSGDKLITLDTSTGLEWLDLTPTFNQSVFDVGLGDFGGYYSAGFRYATTDEVRNLYSGAGIALDGAFSPTNFTGVDRLLQLMGTRPPPCGFCSRPRIAQGMAINWKPGQPMDFGLWQHLATVGQPGPGEIFNNIIELSGTNGRAVLPGTLSPSGDCCTAGPGRASYLVRPTVFSPLSKLGSVRRSCLFGGFCARSKNTQAHNGLDYATRKNTTVRATCNGKFIYVKRRTYPIWSRFTVIEHTNCGGYAKLYAYYGHVDTALSEEQIRKIDKHEEIRIKAGREIGKIAGDWPANRGGEKNAHLHFSLSTNLFSSGWGYVDIGKQTASDCSAHSVGIRRTALLKKPKPGWIDPRQFGEKVGWGTVTVKPDPDC